MSKATAGPQDEPSQANNTQFTSRLQGWLAPSMNVKKQESWVPPVFGGQGPVVEAGPELHLGIQSATTQGKSSILCLTVTLFSGCSDDNGSNNHGSGTNCTTGIYWRDRVWWRRSILSKDGQQPSRSDKEQIVNVLSKTSDERELVTRQCLPPRNVELVLYSYVNGVHLTHHIHFDGKATLDRRRKMHFIQAAFRLGVLACSAVLGRHVTSIAVGHIIRMLANLRNAALAVEETVVIKRDENSSPPLSTTATLSPEVCARPSSADAADGFVQSRPVGSVPQAVLSSTTGGHNETVPRSPVVMQRGNLTQALLRNYAPAQIPSRLHRPTPSPGLARQPPDRMLVPTQLAPWPYAPPGSHTPMMAVPRPSNGLSPNNRQPLHSMPSTPVTPLGEYDSPSPLYGGRRNGVRQPFRPIANTRSSLIPVTPPSFWKPAPASSKIKLVSPHLRRRRREHSRGQNSGSSTSNSSQSFSDGGSPSLALEMSGGLGPDRESSSLNSSQVLSADDVRTISSIFELSI
ncbi:hypothetical protein BV22DRAFT_1043303 [Leucogyrophana mollusca]|uniref:Uncharacterized protein n=1 Tax=Leucogyrophana mollusca TaxID=85980 RepID=A0ACB8BYT1_9AGAM|nr:hypothetical protein BV22DRAFT_1043303 [Leucogyrophana mollusca]